MASTILLFFSLAACMSWARSDITEGFDGNYAVTWGGDRVRIFDDRTEVMLSMDNVSGSGFASKLKYGSGFFHMKIKLPGNNSAGIVTAFYLSSESPRHDELDFEFLGNIEGKPITLQTNIFTNGNGRREQKIKLWFDPTTDVHDYKILWNSHQILFYVDNTPIRVYANKTNIGASYPTRPMKIIASLWNGDNWATNGGKTKVDWSYAPFNAYFNGFDVDGCPSTSSNDPNCSSSSLWWNSDRYQHISAIEMLVYLNVKRKYMTYDYCDDVKRFPELPIECINLRR